MLITISLALTIVIYMGIMYTKKIKFLKFNYIMVGINLAIYVWLYSIYGLTLKWIEAMFLVTTLTIISIIDLKYRIIPNKILAIILVFGVGLNILNGKVAFSNMIIGFFIISVPLLISSIIIKGSIGGGDIKLMAVTGAFLGWEKIVTAFFIASIISSITLTALLILKKVKAKDMVPYGPFLSIGILIASLYN